MPAPMQQFVAESIAACLYLCLLDWKSRVAYEVFFVAARVSTLSSCLESDQSIEVAAYCFVVAAIRAMNAMLPVSFSALRMCFSPAEISAAS